MNKRNNTLVGGIILALIAVLVILSYQNQQIVMVDADKVEELLENQDVFVLQAHEPYQGELKGTDLILEDWQNIGAYTGELPVDRETPILVYCRSGRMSAVAAEQLKELGYKKIYNFEGGMKSWEASGRTLMFK